MRLPRLCSRVSCRQPAVATLTYVYDDSTVVLGPIAVQDEPHGYDLCRDHAHRLTAPRGWQVIRLASLAEEPGIRDDLSALVDALRAAPGSDSGRVAAPIAAGRRPLAQPAQVRGHFTEAPTNAPMREVARKGHLRVLQDGSDASVP